MEIPEGLLKKYNVPVPRYTSYPPANQFKDNFTGDDFIKMIKDSNDGNPQNISFYFHIPFCKKICFYCGCNSCSIGKGDMIIPYIKALRKEITMISDYIDKNRLVSQIHYGGGTPNSIDIAFIQNLNEYILTEFDFIDRPEIAIECNPAYLDYDYIDKLLSSGFNRFSIGIQDLNDEILLPLNRLPSAIPPKELFNYLKEQKNDISVNFDFIYGLPGQTADSFAKTIEEAIKIRPDRLVTFSYAHVPWMKPRQKILEKIGLPSPEEKMKMFLTAYDMLKNAGYMPLGLDHFVLPEDDLYLAFSDHKLHRNFQGYCTRQTTGQVYALGVTAISQMEKGYSQNTKDLREYINSLGKGFFPAKKGYILNKTQMITRSVITELMCNKRIDFSHIAENEGVTLQEIKDSINFRVDRLDELINDKLVNYSDDIVEVTETGSFFIRNIAAVFDKEYQVKDQTYSKNV